MFDGEIFALGGIPYRLVLSLWTIDGAWVTGSFRDLPRRLKDKVVLCHQPSNYLKRLNSVTIVREGAA